VGFAWCAWLVIQNVLPWLALTPVMCLSAEWGKCFGLLGIGAGFALALLLAGGASLFGWRLLR